MKKRFILLIDFSEYSDNLVRYACDWSKQVNAELLLVHQTSVLAPALSDIANKKYLTEHTNNEASQQLKKLAKELIPPGIKVSYFVSETNLKSVLTNLLEEPFENLVFVGLKGSGLLKKIFLGSVALQVIDNTKNTIVAMPKGKASFSPKKLFVAVTDKHPLNILELTNFLKFIDGTKTSITFFYLSKPNEKITGIEKQLSDLSALFAGRFHTNFAIYEGLNPFEDIKSVLNNNTDEMLIIQKGSRLLTDQLFRKFLINELVYEGQTLLIVLP